MVHNTYENIVLCEYMVHNTFENIALYEDMVHNIDGNIAFGEDMVHKSYETQGMAIIMRNIALDSNIMTMEYSILI